MKLRFSIILCQALLAGSMAGLAQTPLSYGFDHPQDSARTKVWWFFGETETTREGITADLEAFKQQGVGGVVYYDQVHGDGAGADKVFDEHWWQSLIFASQEAKRLGLSFEANIGNGYVAGGKWITPNRSMQRLVMSEQVTASPGPANGGVKVRMGLPHRPHNWHHDVAVLAVPYKKSLLGDSRLLNIEPTGSADSVQVFDFGEPFTARSITYEATPQGKARTSAMQVPPFAPRTEMKKGTDTEWRFFGCGFRELADIGILEVSDDGIIYNKVCDLRPKYQNLGGVRQQTVAFPTVRGRYFRVTVTTKEQVKIGNVVVSARARVDEWEEKASLVSEFNDTDRTPIYNKEEMIQADDIVDLTDKMAADGTIVWPNAPQGDWLVMRFMSVSTGGHTKHGRKDALGLECDKLSVEGARLHWQSYTKPVIDSIRAHGGAIEGICMDSHEAGPQNWTQDMPQQFRRLRGYDIRKHLPTIAGGILIENGEWRKENGEWRMENGEWRMENGEWRMENGEWRMENYDYSAGRTADNLIDKRQSLQGNHNSQFSILNSQLLKDFRRTISDLITKNYYGEFNRLCREEGLTLTAQAIGGALCMAGDAIEVKKLVDKPQGEFWGYQTEGNYDIKECSSAAHAYGKLIASGEAFTDITYKHSLADIKNLADYAYAFGINEFVVCAVAYQPYRMENGEWRMENYDYSAGRTMDNTIDKRLCLQGNHNSPFSIPHSQIKINTANGRQYVLNRLNTLWPLSKPFWDYQARCSWMLRQGRPVSDVAVYLGDNLPARIVSHKLPPLPPGYDFDAIGTDVLLHRLTARDSRLMLPDGVSYRLLVLPTDEELTVEVGQRVDEWRRQGIAVYDPRAGQPFDECLRQAGLQPDVDAPGATHLYYCHRQTGQEDIYFLNNHSDQAVSDCFRFRTTATRAELWNPVTGKRKPLMLTADNGRTAIDLTMAPRESYFVVLSNQSSNAAVNTAVATTQELTIEGPWQVQFDESVGAPAEPVTFNELDDWTKHSDPHIRYYSGMATYSNTFVLAEKDKHASYQLRLPLLNVAAEVIVNGKEAGVVWCSPWSADITKQLRKGKNRIELRVCNTLWNRLVGDANRPETERIMVQSHELAKPGDRLVPSGLAGKVTICVE